MSIEDKYLDKFITKLKAFETTKGSKDGTGLTISEFTGGKATNDSELKDLIISNYITPMKKELGSQYESLNEQNFYELLDYKFNTGRSTADLLAYANKDIDLSKANSKNTFSVPKDISSIDINTLRKAKDDLYKTTNGGTLENPSDAYKNSWSGRVFYLSEDPEKSKNEFKKVYDTKDEIKDTTEIKSKMPKENITGTKETKDLALKKQEQITIGNRTINITDGYGIRGKDFKNREGQHSTGIDITTDNERVISLTDGVVEVASLQGSPTLVGTDKEKSGGYYLIIKNDDGTRSQYMHLDAMTPDEQKNIIGKKIKRGDDLGGYGIGSGSGTGPHVKYRVFTGEVGTQSASHIDPSTYISGNNEPPSPPKQNLIVGEDEEGKFVETLINKGTENEKYVKEYVKGAEQLGIRTIGNNEYVVKG